MVIFLYTLVLSAVLLSLWLAVIASVALWRDDTLTGAQKAAQMTVAWVFPLLGASLVLHLVWLHSPEAVPRSLIPWPFRTVVIGRERVPNWYRDDNEIWNGGNSFYTRGGEPDDSGSTGTDGDIG